MKPPRICLPETNQGNLNHSKTWTLFCIASVLAFTLLLSCVPTKEMTLQEAKQVTVSMSGKAFTPPPRTIKDILAILEGTSQKEMAELKEAEKIAASTPPPDAGARKLGEYYWVKLAALKRLGRFEQAFAEAKEMAKLAQKMNVVSSVPKAFVAIAGCARISGDTRQAIEFYELALPMLPQGWTMVYKSLVEAYVSVGDLERAKRWLDEGTRECARLLTWSNHPTAPYWNGCDDSMQATFLEAEGNFVAAEPLRRRAIGYWKQYLSPKVRDQSMIGTDIYERALLISETPPAERVASGGPPRGGLKLGKVPQAFSYLSNSNSP